MATAREHLVELAQGMGLSGTLFQPGDLERMTDPAFSLSLSGEEISHAAMLVGRSGSQKRVNPAGKPSSSPHGEFGGVSDGFSSPNSSGEDHATADDWEAPTAVGTGGGGHGSYPPREERAPLS